MILYNAIRCKLCDDIIESKHRHDFVWCKCGKSAVDGGHDYSRIIGNSDNIEELSVSDDGTHETRRQYLRWGVNYDKYMNRLPETEWKLIKDMDSGHIQAIIDGEYAKGYRFMEELFKQELKFRENGKS
jgi:hypothetical protein